MKNAYISPELEIFCFVPMENVANSVNWYNWDAVTLNNGSGTETEEAPDMTLPGGLVPGWGH